ncbi:hypothetical protein CF319_g6185 [Tilletia indica]|nr:hypothetical protein CF319_g6185 [Tilletia indica]
MADDSNNDQLRKPRASEDRDAGMDDNDSIGSGRSSVRVGDPALQNALAALEEFDQSEMRHEYEEQLRSVDRSSSEQEKTRERLRYYEDQSPLREDEEEEYDDNDHTGTMDDSRRVMDQSIDDEGHERTPYYDDDENEISRESQRQPLEDDAHDQVEEQDGMEEVEAEEAAEEEEGEEEGGVEEEEDEEPEQNVSGGVDATMIYNPDASLLPPILRPAWQRGSPEPRSYGQYNANSSTPRRDQQGARSPAKNHAFYQDKLGGDIFSPIKLQRMFNPPTPPSVDSASPDVTFDAPGPSQPNPFRSSNRAHEEEEEQPSQRPEDSLNSNRDTPAVSPRKGDTTSADEGEVEAVLGSLNKVPVAFSKPVTPEPQSIVSTTQPQPIVSTPESYRTDSTPKARPVATSPEPQRAVTTPERSTIAAPQPETASSSHTASIEQTGGQSPSMTGKSSTAGVPFAPLTPRKPMKLFSRGTPMFVFRASPSPSARTSASRSSGGSAGPRLTVARDSDSSGSAPPGGGQFEVGAGARTPSDFVRKLQRMRSMGRLRGSAQRPSRRSIHPERLGGRRSVEELGEALEEEDEDEREAEHSAMRSKSISGVPSSSTPSPSVVRIGFMQEHGLSARQETSRSVADDDQWRSATEREHKRMKIAVDEPRIRSRSASLNEEAKFLSRSLAEAEASPESLEESRRIDHAGANLSAVDHAAPTPDRSAHSTSDDGRGSDRGQVYLSQHAEQQAHVVWNRHSMGPDPFRHEDENEHSLMVGAMPGLRLGVSAGPPRDYVREAPSFMQLIRQQGLGSDAMTITTTRSALGSGLGSGTTSGSASVPASVAASGSGPMSRTQSASSITGTIASNNAGKHRGMADEFASEPLRGSLTEDAAADQEALTQFSFRIPLPAGIRNRSVSYNATGGPNSSLAKAGFGPRYPSQFGIDISEDEVDAALGGTGRDQEYLPHTNLEQRRVQSAPARAPGRSPSKTVSFAGLSPRRVAFSKTVASTRQSPRKLLRQFSAAAEVEWELAEEEEDQALVQEQQPEQRIEESGNLSSLQQRSPVEAPGESPADQIQALIERKTSAGSSDPLRKSTLVHISPEEFNMPIEALENVLGQGRMTFDRNAGKWVKNKSRSRANSEVDKRSVATSRSGPQVVSNSSDSQEGMSELEAGSDEAKPKSASSRTTTEEQRSQEGGQSVSHASSDSTPDPFKNIESFSHSGKFSSRRVISPIRDEASVSQVADKSQEPTVPPAAEVTARDAWPRESTPPVSVPSPAPPTRVDDVGSQSENSGTGPQTRFKEFAAHDWRNSHTPAAAAAYANRPKYSSLLRQEVKLMQSASTASVAGSDVDGPTSPARLLDVAAALAQEYSVETPELIEEADRTVVGQRDPVPALPAPQARPPSPPPQASPSPQPPPSPYKSQQPQSPSPLKPILITRSPTKSALASTPHQSPTKNLRDDTRRSISFCDTPRASQLNRRRQEIDEDAESVVHDVPHRPESPTPRRLSVADVSIGQVSARTMEIAQAIQHLAELTLTQDDPDPSDVGDTSALALFKGADVLSSRRQYGREDGGHMTLATNASFSVARDRIVELIADVAPWEEHWEEMEEIDLSGRRVDTVLRLRDFCPALESVNLNRNELSYLTGLPTGVRVLKAAENRLSNMTLFDHLRHLETLDISGNQLTSLRNLESLTRLKDLKANDNAITDVRGLLSLTALRRLSLRGNKLTHFDAASLDAGHLERLDLSRNSIRMVASLYRLRDLRELNLDHNALLNIDLGPKMARLRILRISFNPELSHLDVLPARKLNTLYVDGCSIAKVDHLGALNGLENFSIRQQATGAVHWRADETRDAKRLFFSGNAFIGGLLGYQDGDADASDASDASRSSDSHSTIPKANSRKRSHPDASGKLRDPTTISPPITLFTLVYLELSGCQLTAFPAALPSQLPNLRHLNLDHNLFTTLPGLQALTRLKRLSLVGCRIRSSQSILRAVQGLPELLVLDTRMNPCTLGLYPPVIVVSPLAPTPHGSGDGRAMSHVEAALPPIPNPEVAQPDVLPHNLRKAQREQKEQRQRAEKSFFHKRSSALDPLEGSSAEESETDARSSTMASTVTDDNEGMNANAPSRKRKLERAAAAAGAPVGAKVSSSRSGNTKVASSSSPTTSSALFLASDARFLKTLPLKFIQRRQAHRGLLALGCPALVWLDGLVVEWAEVEVAQEFVEALRADREARQQDAGPSSRRPSRTMGNEAERESTGRGTETDFWMPPRDFRLDDQQQFHSLP